MRFHTRGLAGDGENLNASSAGVALPCNAMVTDHPWDCGRARAPRRTDVVPVDAEVAEWCAPDCTNPDLALCKCVDPWRTLPRVVTHNPYGAALHDEYFRPDRSDRPVSSARDGVREIATPHHADRTLRDGRPVVTEHALVDGFHATYYYVDARGLENASMDELRALLADAGVGWPDRLDGRRVHASHELKQDAQGQDILEVAVIRPPLD